MRLICFKLTSVVVIMPLRMAVIGVSEAAAPHGMIPMFNGASLARHVIHSLKVTGHTQPSRRFLNPRTHLG